MSDYNLGLIVLTIVAGGIIAFVWYMLGEVKAARKKKKEQREYEDQKQPKKSKPPILWGRYIFVSGFLGVYLAIILFALGIFQGQPIIAPDPFVVRPYAQEIPHDVETQLPLLSSRRRYNVSSGTPWRFMYLDEARLRMAPQVRDRRDGSCLYLTTFDDDSDIEFWTVRYPRTLEYYGAIRTEVPGRHIGEASIASGSSGLCRS